jgi:hypothetical protein
MVRAILAGEKTQTRRIVDRKADHTTRLVHVRGRTFDVEHHKLLLLARCPYGGWGDRLWVREKMRVMAVAAYGGEPDHVTIRYEADGTDRMLDEWPARLADPVVGRCLAYGGPREASRIDLSIETVRVERLQDITEADAHAEGVTRENVPPLLAAADRKRVWPIARDDRELFSLGWNAINGKRAPWASNPWVWVIVFRLVRP